MLQSTNRELKSLNYRLNRVITSKASHIELAQYRANEIEVLASTPILCKVSTKSQSAPLRVEIVFKSHREALRIFVSKTHSDPNEKNCDFIINNVSFFNLNLLERQILCAKQSTHI